MKKICLSGATFGIFLAIFSLTACRDVIFDTIRDEVKLEDAQVVGDINSLIRFKKQDGKEYLFADNGNIWYKDVDNAFNGTPTTTSPYSGQWHEAREAGISANHIIRLAADATYLYAFGAKVEANNDSGYMEPTLKALYYSADDGETWTEVTAITIPSLESAVTLFCTNAVQTAHRKAFVNVAGTLYLLDGENVTALDATTTAVTFLNTETISTSTSAAYFDGIYYVSSYRALETNETKDSEATFLYRSDGDYLYYFTATTDETGATLTPTDSDAWVVRADADATIFAIAYTADYILLGTADGLLHVKHTESVPDASTSDSPTNADSTLSSYYEIFVAIAIDPSATTTGGDIYGTTTFSGSTSSTGANSNNVGLWAYYPGRGNWNRE